MPSDDGAVQARLRALGLRARAERLALVARALVDGGAPGSHPSRVQGEGAEFAGHKPYASGDDPRQIDWKIAARSDRLVVRRFEAERHLAAEVLLDVSRSMEFGSVAAGEELDRPSTKSEAAAMAAAVLSYRLLRQGDSVAVTLAGEVPRGGPRRAGEGQLDALCHDLAAAIPARDGAARLDRAVARSVARLSRPGLIVVLTDALDEDQGWIDELAAGRSRGHDALVIQVMDPAERDLPYDEPALFVDPETGQQVRIHPARVRAVYRDLLVAHLERTRERLHAARLDHLLVHVGAALGATLGAFLERRSRRPARLGGRRA